MLEYKLWLAVENSARYFPEPTLLYSIHSYGVILVLEVGDHTILHFSKSKLPAHPFLMDVHGGSVYVTVYTKTRVFWLSKPNIHGQQMLVTITYPLSISLIN
jgi:hypothetical protein